MEESWILRDPKDLTAFHTCSCPCCTGIGASAGSGTACVGQQQSHIALDPAPLLAWIEGAVMPPDPLPSHVCAGEWPSAAGTPSAAFRKHFTITCCDLSLATSDTNQCMHDFLPMRRPRPRCDWASRRRSPLIPMRPAWTKCAGSASEELRRCPGGAFEELRLRRASSASAGLQHRCIGSASEDLKHDCDASGLSEDPHQEGAGGASGHVRV